MIFTALFQIVVVVVDLLMKPFGLVTELPFGVSSFISAGMSYFRSMMDFFPPFQTIAVAGLFYFGFKILLLGAKIIFGSRLPVLER